MNHHSDRFADDALMIFNGPAGRGQRFFRAPNPTANHFCSA
jgi:hypothetical protein